MPENSPNIKIHYQKPVFIKGRSNGQEKRNFSDALKKFSGFVFLVSMKYVKDEEKAKRATVNILKEFLNNNEEDISEQDLKTNLYMRTKAYFETHQ